MSRFIQSLVAFALLISPGTLTTQSSPVVEDTIAGITVGNSTLGDVQQKFGRRLKVDEEVGRYAVKIDGQCELFFDLGLEEPGPDQTNSRVMNIQLLNLGKGGDRGSPCNELVTGRGLKLSDSPDKMMRIYGNPNG
jgi:hypothetical protein